MSKNLEETINFIISLETLRDKLHQRRTIYAVNLRNETSKCAPLKISFKKHRNFGSDEGDYQVSKHESGENNSYPGHVKRRHPRNN